MNTEKRETPGFHYGNTVGESVRKDKQMQPGPELDAAVGDALGLDMPMHWDAIDWQPSLSIKHAWQVVEWLVAEGYEVFIEYDDSRWYCQVRHEGTPSVAFARLTAPHAISLAALAAMEAAE